MAAVIHKKGAPENFVWEETEVGSPARGQAPPCVLLMQGMNNARLRRAR